MIDAQGWVGGKYRTLRAAPKTGAESNTAFGVKWIPHGLQPSLIVELFCPDY